MNSELQLATTRDFNGITLNCYRENGQEDPQDFWATREQIGQALGYEYPRETIGKIHHRNKARLDKFSRVVKMTTERNSMKTREVTLYNFKGLLEICRYSNQPNAHKVIDVLWDIADEIRRTGMYITTRTVRRLEERVTELEKQAEADYPVKLLGSIVLAQPESITFQSAAHFLAQHGFDIGQNRLYKKCRDKKLLCSRRGRQKNKPTQKAVEQGLFEVSIRDGFRPITMVTPKGLATLTDLVARETYPLLILMEDETPKNKQKSSRAFLGDEETNCDDE